MPQTPHIVLASILAVIVAGCGPETNDPEPPDPIGPRVYRVFGGYCSDDCPDLFLYRKGDALQMLALDGDGSLVQETLASLAEQPAAIIDEASAQLLSGADEFGTVDPECLSFLDKATVELSLLGTHNIVSVSYPQACAPTGLTEIDAQYDEALTAMTTCDSGDIVILDDGCVPIR
jgi:hypothetical protein